MKNIRNVVRLKSTTDMSERQIARALNISRPVVAQYWKDFQASGLDYEGIGEMPDSELLALFERPRVEKSGKYRQLLKRFPGIAVELKRKGVTLQLLWQEYKREQPEGFEYTQFCYHYQVWKSGSEVTMHQQHKAGEKMFVDYAGAKLAITDRLTGEQREVETFVAILGASGLTYAEASESQQIQDWIRSNERALWYFQGVCGAIVPDNLRSAVSSSNRYEPGINPSFDDFSQYYGTVIIPARVREARDKALAENAVKLVYQRIYAPLRDRIFYSLEELNEAISERLEEHNNTPLQRLDLSRRELFEQIEREALRPLPAEKYPLKHIKEVTVGINYHVELREDRHYYSVPYYLRKRSPKTVVKMIWDERTVSIYYQNVRLVEHKRDRRPNDYTTLPEHMPPNHRFYAEWSPDRFLRWAAQIGEEVRCVVQRVLKSRKHPEQAFRVCLGILNLSKSYGKEALKRVCREANTHGIYSYRRIEAMLKLQRQEEKQTRLEWEQKLPSHENIRGSHYYH
jgi:transposase